MQSQATWTIRQTRSSDQALVSSLLANASHKHFHFDWLNVLDLLEEAPFLIALNRERPMACLACQPDPPQVAWIRLFAAMKDVSKYEVWDRLWMAAAERAVELGASQAVALATQTWLIPFLKESGFEETNEVIFFKWDGDPLPEISESGGVLRKMTLEDLPAVARVDQSAFDPVWALSLRSLRTAYRLSSLATVISQGEQIIAYQMSTSSALGAHIARLAVHPDLQGMGCGRALIANALHVFPRRGLEQVTVNTQADNLRGQQLYRSLGFLPTGQRFSLLETKLAPR
ncbi:MAG: GNAT family N-acetyltransferase [Anaerolineales bacterium]|nr:GNAT family N-acetyltransferase [Anaerolineales bacterium]